MSLGLAYRDTPFDLIPVYEDMKILKRLRVGYETVEVNPYIDQYAIYSTSTYTCHYIEADKIHDCNPIISLEIIGE